MLQPSDKCLEIIQECEGFSSTPYLCPAKIPTIGFGSTVYEDGTPVTLKDAPITVDRAKAIMTARLNSEFVPAVQRYVQVPLNQNQFDALVDFAYNLGAGALRTSTLLKYINSNKFSLAAAEFDKWIMSAGKPLPGLVKRRRLERTLFETQ
jgi:lysozyme